MVEMGFVSLTLPRLGGTRITGKHDAKRIPHQWIRRQAFAAITSIPLQWLRDISWWNMKGRSAGWRSREIRSSSSESHSEGLLAVHYWRNILIGSICPVWNESRLIQFDKIGLWRVEGIEQLSLLWSLFLHSGIRSYFRKILFQKFNGAGNLLQRIPQKPIKVLRFLPVCPLLCVAPQKQSRRRNTSTRKRSLDQVRPHFP